MKKLIIIALIIGFASACTKSSVQYERPGEISFRPVTAMTTKAAVTGTEYPKDAAHKFNVWAWWIETSDTTRKAYYPEYAEMYLNKRTFKHDSGNSWVGDEVPYFWPTRGSLVFAGYSPVSAIAQNFSYSWANREMTITAYQQPTDISETVDLMWFDVTERSYSDNNNKNAQAESVNGVPVVFKHLLSWLTFQYKKKDGASASYIVTDVKLQGIETKARFISRPAAGNEEWSDQTDPKPVQIWSGSYQVTTEAVAKESTTAGVLVIPQPCTAEHVQLQVTYKTSESGPKQTRDVYLTAGTDGHIWKPGKHYTYTITFGDNEILVLPDVTDWETVTVDIEVQ
ncbi:MAG: fimbrillin family protein [Bacteroidales bacterium]|nr:fimbrillin family protein [Bacteroidales bacterium]